MFIAGLQRSRRHRGSGRLTCPHCHEYTLTTVDDDMRFLALLFYRFTPVSRRRLLTCQSCHYERPATRQEMSLLTTAGTRIHRAGLVPTGFLSIAVVVGLWYVTIGSEPAVLAEKGISFQQTNGQVIPVQFDKPVSWAFDTSESDAPVVSVTTYSTGTGNMGLTLRRFPHATTLAELIVSHFQDESGLNATSFPTEPPAATCTTLAGEKAARVILNYDLRGEAARVTMYAFFHSGIGYTLSYTAEGDESITTVDAIAEHVNESLHFFGVETPASSKPPVMPLESPSPAYAVSC